MEWLENFRPEYALLILAAVVAGWFALRVLFRLTVRLFTCAVAVATIAGAGYLLFRFVL
ncbi:MAG: hypothetical protein P1P76_01205 [Anaerolineales bacterium]|nr:hypothetical protein [Anaerolineales bacterium]